MHIIENEIPFTHQMDTNTGEKKVLMRVYWKWALTSIASMNINLLFQRAIL